MKTYITVGNLRIKALVKSIDDIFVFDEVTPHQLRVATNLINHTLGAFGEYRAGKEIELQNGAVRVPILNVRSDDNVSNDGAEGEEHEEHEEREEGEEGEEGEAKFDLAAYHAFLRKVKCSMSTPLDLQDQQLDLSDRSALLAEQTGCDPVRIRRALSMIGIKHCSATVLVEEDDAIELCAPSQFVAPRDWSEIIVAEKGEYAWIKTSKGIFRLRAADAVGLMPGDRVVLVEPGASEKRRCIFADRAILAEEDEPDLFD